jgi:hypothetical protein
MCTFRATAWARPEPCPGPRGAYSPWMSSTWGRARRVRRGLFIVVVVLVCVAVGVPALAYTSRSNHTYVIRSGKGPQFGSSTATCAPGETVLFGGFSNGVAGMRRTASNRLTVDGFNLGGQPLWLSAFAYCGHGPVPTKATNTVRVTSSGTATAQCPAGKVVLAGGFASTPRSVIAMTRLERVGTNRLRVSAYLRYGITKRTLLTAIAYCGTGPAPKLVSQTLTLPKGGGQADATCPAGTKLVFGGVIAKGAGYHPLVFSMAALDQNTWRVRESTDKRAAATLTSLAYCR